MIFTIFSSSNWKRGRGVGGRGPSDGGDHGRRRWKLNYLCDVKTITVCINFRSSGFGRTPRSLLLHCLHQGPAIPGALIGAEPIRQRLLLPHVDGTQVTRPSARRNWSFCGAYDKNAVQAKCFTSRASAFRWPPTNQSIYQTSSTQKRPLELSTVLCHICTQSDCRLSSQSRTRH